MKQVAGSAMSVGRTIAIAFCCAMALLLEMPSKVRSQPCFDCEPAFVELSGTVSVEEAYGPPGYGEEPETDSKVQFLLLTLDAPICVNPDPNDPVNSEGKSRISSLHMVYGSGYQFRHEWLEPRVIVTGTLFRALTGHHRTPVLINVSETRIADGD